MAPDADTFADTSAPADGQREQRLRKAGQARGSGYPYRYPTDASAAGIRAAHAGLAPDQVTEHEVHIAGRLELIRRQGGLTFATLRDRTGTIQLFVDTAVVGAAVHRDFDELDRGDWVGVAGTVMTTRRGELSVRVGEFALLAKALLPPPDKHRGLTDVETRYRQRYVDLEANERTREIFRIRHAAIHAIRDHLNGLGFTEVEGPVLQTIQGGASARPFVTHHNALDIDLYLRIALELHLKRLIVGGLERVFEIGRVFRNEGIDTRHNPEFTMLEAYQAFADYHDMMDLTEGLVSAAAKAALGDATTVHYAGQAIDLTTPWPRARFADMIAEKTGATMHPDMPIAQARAVLDRLHIPYESSWGAGRLMKEVYDEKVQHDVVGPVFCIDYPREVSPLARVHRDDPAYVERFELIVAGFELCNAYSEQNDPAEQLAAFEAEARAKQGGDPEAGDVDHDYIRALEHGMPPTGGLGIGIDRLVMLLASVDSIREVILFPTLRPEFAPPPGGGPGGAPRPLAAPTPIAPGSVAGPSVDGAAPTSVVALPSMAPSVHTITPPEPRELHQRAVRTIAGLTALCGVLQLLSMVPFVHSRFGAARGRDRAAVGAHRRPRRVGDRRAAADPAGRPARQAQTRGLAGRGGAVRGRRPRAPGQGAAPDRAGVLRRHAGRAGRLPAVLRRAGRPAVAVPPRPVRAAVPARRAGLRRRRALVGARPDHPGAEHRRRAGDGVRWPRGARRPVHLPVADLRGLLPGGAGRAGRRRPGRVRDPAVPAAGRAQRAHRGRLGARHAPRARLRLGHAGLLRAA